MSEMTRGEFLRAVGVGIAATAVPAGASAVLRQTNPQGALTVEELEIALRAANITFEREDVTRVLASVNRAREAYPALRQTLENETVMPGLAWRMLEAADLPPNPKVSVKTRKADLPALVSPKDLPFLSVVELAALVKAKRLSSVDLTMNCLDRLERYGDKLLCVVNTCRDRALADAKRADEEIRAGKYKGPLHGIPYGVKDLFDVKDYPSTWGCKTFENRLATTDSDVVQRLSAAVDELNHNLSA